MSLLKNIITRLACLGILFICTINNGSAQEVTGNIVSSESQNPLSGATVQVKRTLEGALSDQEGNFSVPARKGDTLLIRFIGYANQEIIADPEAFLRIVMTEDYSSLEEIVVLGYSSRSQKELSAAVTTIKADKLNQMTSPNVETMLQGRVAGLTVSSSTGQPGVPADIRIRGITSINADRPPLFVVDGMIGGTFIPNDVESLTVLKDAAAIGLYGSAGAAGVIVVTTKKGTSSKPVVSFMARTGVKQVVTGNYSMMNGEQLYAAQKSMWGENQVSFLLNRPQELEDINYDWQNAGFRQAMVQNYNLAIRGNSKNTAYSVSVDYFDEEGTFINTDFQRLNLNGNLRFNLSDKVTVQSDINIQASRDKGFFYSWFEDAFYNMPWDTPTDADGNLYGPRYVTNPGNDWYGQFRRSFLYSADFNELGSQGSSVVWSNRIKYDITSWLSAEVRTRMNTFYSKYSEYFAPNTDEGLAQNGYVGQNNSDGWGVLSTHFLRANKSFGNHQVGGFVAHEGGYSTESFLNFAGENLSSATIKVPDGASIINGGGYTQSYAGISYIGEGSYNYNNKYFATAYFRRDGSSLFAVEKRFGNFYGGSLGWLLSEENWFVNAEALDLFKLRVSYGLTGNSNIPPFLDLATYNITRNYNGLPAGEPNNPANPFLGWETTIMTNAGVDISLWKNALRISVDVYQKSVEGMLLNNPLPFSSGYQSRTENIGDMRNRGVEASFIVEKRFGDFLYSGNLNFAYNQNQITKITDVLDQQTVQAGAIQQINIVGEEAFQWYMPTWVGVDPETGGPIWEKIIFDDNGQELSRTTTNQYIDATFQANGSALPKMNGGFSNSLNYKGFGISVLFTFQQGNQIYHYTREFVDSDGANTGINLMELQDDWSRWEEVGDVATHPRLTRGGTEGAHQTSSRYIEDGSYVRLRNVSLSYQMPSRLLVGSGISQASISLNADNLWTGTEFSGMDPDVGLNVESYSLPGLSFIKYPISKQYAVSINLGF